MDVYKKAKFSAERELYVRYAEKERNILAFQSMLNLSYDTCAELYKMLEDEVKGWTEITPYSFLSIWEPSLQRVLTMMAFGIWNLEDWKKEVSNIVHRYHFKNIASDWMEFEWESIEEIKWN